MMVIIDYILVSGSISQVSRLTIQVMLVTKIVQYIHGMLLCPELGHTVGTNIFMRTGSSRHLSVNLALLSVSCINVYVVPN